jgi:2-polyprenyl-3-methyl-5-hydroxy-6-metoxy-1,4-benzoquinol methylase
MQVIDDQAVKRFWEQRAGKDEHATNLGLNALDEEKQQLKKAIEEQKVLVYLRVAPHHVVLDLGCGNGKWALALSPSVRDVYAVDYCQEMLDAAAARSRELGCQNVHFIHCAVQSFVEAMRFDRVLLSGVCLHLNDHDFARTVTNLRQMTEPGALVVIRDTTGIAGRHELNGKYSAALGTHYSAIYRSRSEYIETLGAGGFVLQQDEDMFADHTGLNLYPETKLRIYRFIREAS